MITNLHLINFRSYLDTSFEFSPLTVIVGPNGRGKTNIVEALFFLSTGRSFRTVHDRELIHFGQPFGRIVSGPLDITVVDGPRVQKQVRIHGKSVRLLSVLGVQPSVLFTPMSISLIDGSPALRRQYIDILLSQTNPLYARGLLEYQRVLKQRNELLHRIQAGDEDVESLSLWDDLLVTTSIPVLTARKRMAETIEFEINRWYQYISSNKDDVVASTYLSSVEKRHTVGESEIKLDALFHDRLRERRVTEIAMGRTVIGPHRDDLIITLNGKPISDYGSRGEMRSAVVALKLFEYMYIKEYGEKVPSLLFDDVFSEFDPARRKAIFTIVPEAQMILTATDLKAIGRLPSRAQVINL